jgi:hypothetical protein
MVTSGFSGRNCFRFFLFSYPDATVFAIAELGTKQKLPAYLK